MIVDEKMSRNPSDHSGKSRTSSSDGPERPAAVERDTIEGSTRRDRPAVVERSATESSARRDRDRMRRERQRSSSPSRQGDAGSVGERRDRPNRTATNPHRNRRQRKSITGSTTGAVEVGWNRVGKNPSTSKRTTIGRGVVASRQLMEMVQSPFSSDNIEEGFDVLAAAHAVANTEHIRANLLSADENAANNIDPFLDFSAGTANGGTATKRASTAAAAIASNKDIDNVIAQFREQCDVHLATLLELKNNITTTEKEVNVSTEKEKEFQQVRQWYSDLATKHTKLQKEHQALQEEHVKLQEKYMNLKAASNLHESAVFDGVEKKKKKEKKEKKSMSEVVWSRAVKPTGIAAGKVAGTVANKVYVCDVRPLELVLLTLRTQICPLC
jgi:hypothetical protein